LKKIEDQMFYNSNNSVLANGYGTDFTAFESINISQLDEGSIKEPWKAAAGKASVISKLGSLRSRLGKKRFEEDLIDALEDSFADMD